MPVDIIRRLTLQDKGGIEVYKQEEDVGITYVQPDGRKYFTVSLSHEEVSELQRMLRGVTRSMKLSGRKRGPRLKTKTAIGPSIAPQIGGFEPGFEPHNLSKVTEG